MTDLQDVQSLWISWNVINTISSHLRQDSDELFRAMKGMSVTKEDDEPGVYYAPILHSPSDWILSTLAVYHRRYWTNDLHNHP